MKVVWTRLVNPWYNGLVHPKINISLWFNHPWGILGVYDFLLSDESSQSYIKNCPGYSKCYHCSGCFCSTVQNTSNKERASIIKRASHSFGAWIKASCSESMPFCKKNIHISNVINTFLSLPLSVIHWSRSGGWRRTYASHMRVPLRYASLASLFTGAKEAKFPYFSKENQSPLGLYRNPTTFFV